MDPPFVSHEQALVSIRNFLKGRSSYDVFPVSFRLIVLDTKLMVKKALGVMLQNGQSRISSPTTRATIELVSARRNGRNP